MFMQVLDAIWEISVETWTVDEKGAEVSRTITTAILSMEKKSES